MNKTISNYAREKIKQGLAKLLEKHRIFFKRMYSQNNMDRPINDIVDDMPEGKLNWALTQIENTIRKNSLPK